MSLAVLYRPQAWENIVGNTATVSSLKAILERPLKDVPHAILLSGPSGCGKTTLARIISDTLGCGPMDLTELDAAHFRGIDTVRDMRQQAGLSPVSGKVRVWILDEAQQLSKDAQNGLLKLLEDAPSKSYFILCTTDPEKLLPTIRNRCMAFVVQPLEPDEITGLLNEVVEAEGKSVPAEVIAAITQNCLGSPRLALVTLDRIIDLAPKEMKAAAIKAAEAESTAIELFRALLAKKNWGTVSEILRRIPSSEDPESIRRGALGYAAAVLSKSDHKTAFVMLDAFREPYYNVGRPGLVYSCYLVVNG